MLNAIGPGVLSSAVTPVLDFWAQRSITDAEGFTFFGLGAPQALAFEIWSLKDPDAPTIVGTRHTVDLVNDRIGGIDGHYAAAVTTPATKARYQIRWFFTPMAGADEIVVSYDFDVLPAASGVLGAGTAYALVSDLREEGICSDATDARLLRVLVEQSRYIERVTHRSFRPTLKTAVFSGSGGRRCLLGEPLIALVGVALGDRSDVYIERSSFRVFNRHIANGMLDPDDRVDPQIEFAHFNGWGGGVPSSLLIGQPVYSGSWIGRVFPLAVQNVTIRGLWGYTDFDGGPVGSTPVLITKVAKLLAVREIPGIGSAEREDIRARSRLTGERTRDQSYTREAEVQGNITGDREIDDILDMYSAPMQIASA